jgi:hypothetical protein
MKLTNDEKKYLWTKTENRKKKKAIETENTLYKLLNGDKTNFNTTESELIIKSLEFTFRKRLIGDKPDLKHELFMSIKNKLPDDLIIVKQGNINTKPSKSSTKKEIIDYLKRKKINYNEKDTKTKLLGLFENENIKTFNGFVSS